MESIINDLEVAVRAFDLISEMGEHAFVMNLVRVLSADKLRALLDSIEDMEG